MGSRPTDGGSASKVTRNYGWLLRGRRHPLRRRRRGRSRVRRLPFPPAFLLDLGRAVGNRPADAPGTRRTLRPDPDRTLLASPVARLGGGGGEAADPRADHGTG